MFMFKFGSLRESSCANRACELLCLFAQLYPCTSLLSLFDRSQCLKTQKEEGIQLVSEAICSGIFNDLGSGSNVDVCVITKGKTEYLRNHKLPNPRTYVSSKGYNFTKGHTEVLSTKITPLKSKVGVAEGDVMEE